MVNPNDLHLPEHREVSRLAQPSSSWRTMSMRPGSSSLGRNGAPAHQARRAGGCPAPNNTLRLARHPPCAFALDERSSPNAPGYMRAPGPTCFRQRHACHNLVLSKRHGVAAEGGRGPLARAHTAEPHRRWRRPPLSAPRHLRLLGRAGGRGLHERCVRGLSASVCNASPLRSLLSAPLLDAVRTNPVNYPPKLDVTGARPCARRQPTKPMPPNMCCRHVVSTVGRALLLLLPLLALQPVLMLRLLLLLRLLLHLSCGVACVGPTPDLQIPVTPPPKCAAELSRPGPTTCAVTLQAAAPTKRTSKAGGGGGAPCRRRRNARGQRRRQPKATTHTSPPCA